MLNLTFNRKQAFFEMISVVVLGLCPAIESLGTETQSR